MSGIEKRLSTYFDTLSLAFLSHTVTFRSSSGLSTESFAEQSVPLILLNIGLNMKPIKKTHKSPPPSIVQSDEADTLEKSSASAAMMKVRSSIFEEENSKSE
jgi:hypothetical protein